MDKKRTIKSSLPANILITVIIVACFIVSSFVIRDYAKKDCYARIEEAANQAAEMLTYSMADSQEKLAIFAEFLAANSNNSDKQMKQYMSSFCQTQVFSSLCIHKADGTTISYGIHPHTPDTFPSFEGNVASLSDISPVISTGETADKKFFCQSVPIDNGNGTEAILYGYTPLSMLPKMVTTTAYNGNCQLYLVDSDTGDFLMDTWHEGSLGNIHSMEEQKTKAGYDADQMKEGILNRQSGYYIFFSQAVDRWFYTYYMPAGINNWSLQLTIDEPTAFTSYNNINIVITMLATAVILFTILQVVILMVQSFYDIKKEERRLRKANYMYDVQRLLFNAHHAPDLIEQALKEVAKEMKAETVLLITFSDKNANQIYYWPSKDKPQVAELFGRNVRDDFPVLFDLLSENKSVVYDSNVPAVEMTQTAREIFEKLEVSNIMLIPILEHTGILKGTLSAVNMAEKRSDCDTLECVAYDFFMAITNIENHNVIKNMGTMDYLTNTKNRNSYETELSIVALYECKSLWCIFVDVNGLHELNNTAGHKAGDLMLCTVAEVTKKAFGSQYTYRVGGDEFVSFVFDSTHEEILEKKTLINEELGTNGYHVSIGFSSISKHNKTVLDVEHVVAEAETRMYQEKHDYYKKNNISHERKHL